VFLKKTESESEACLILSMPGSPRYLESLVSLSLLVPYPLSEDPRFSPGKNVENLSSVVRPSPSSPGRITVESARTLRAV